MIKNSAETERESLGEFLRKTREEQGISLEDVAEATRLSLSSLIALEADDYANLPAEAFVRGFYGIYAEHLCLDPIIVRERYAQQLKNMPRRSTKRIPTPTQLAVETSSMAERPSVNSISIIGLTLMAAFIIMAALSWYLSWNPATFLSQKLRGVPAETEVSAKQQGEVQEVPNETTTPPGGGPIAAAPTTAPVAPVDGQAGPDRPATDQPAQEKSLVVPPIMPITPEEPPKSQASIAVPPLQTAEAPQAQAPEKPLPTPGTNTYLLKAIATQSVQVTIKVDETPTERFTLSAGEQRVWNAGKSIVISLPAGTGTTFTLNDIPLNLPRKTLGEEISISIPEYLLE